MSRTLAAIIVAAVPTFMAVAGFVHEHCASTHRTDTDASALPAPRYAGDARTGFGSPDFVIECLGADEAPVRTSESYCADSGN